MIHVIYGQNNRFTNGGSGGSFVDDDDENSNGGFLPGNGRNVVALGAMSGIPEDRVDPLGVIMEAKVDHLGNMVEHRVVPSGVMATDRVVSSRETTIAEVHLVV